MLISVTTKRGTANELATRDLLIQLLARYDVSAWAFTKRVVIDEKCIPHSHPVLTLSPFLVFREPEGLLATYLHEQIHWQLAPRRGLRRLLRIEEAPVRAARKDLHGLFPSVPPRAGGGAQNDASTYLHLLVCWLEVEALKRVAGEETAQRMLTATVDGPVYGWVYRQVQDRPADIGTVITKHQLLGPLAQ